MEQFVSIINNNNILISSFQQEKTMEYFSQILSFLVGLGAGWTLKFVVDRSSRNTVAQIGNKAGGDVAGRDINKK